MLGRARRKAQLAIAGPKACVFILFLMLFVPAYSSPIGNPAISLLEQGLFIPDTSWSNLQCGFTGDDLFRKRFCARTSSQNLGLHKANLRGVSQTWNLTWNIRERCNLQGEIGSGRFRWIWEQSPNTAIAGQVSEGLIWSGNAQLVIFEIQDTILAADVHAGGWDWMKGHANANGVALPGIVQSTMRYWQAGAALSQKIGSLFAPYFGIVVNRSRLKLRKLESGIGWLRSRHTIGPFLGCTLTQGTIISLNIEWRGGFEQGVALSGQIRF